MTSQRQPLVERIANDFKYHAPNSVKIDKHESMRMAGLDLANKMASQCPESRELSCALTSLEEAVFWANAAIARNE